MNTSEIFTKKNIEILKLLSQKGFHIREIAKRCQCSPAHVTHTIRRFVHSGIVREEKIGNKLIVQLNFDNPSVSHILKLIGDSSPTESRINIFDTISPIDYRYYGRDQRSFIEFSPYLSETGFIHYALKVEEALTKTLARRRLCSEKVAQEVSLACKKVTAFEVYAEEDRIKHNIRALANCIRNHVSEEAKPFVHFTATSHDIICSADAARFKDFTHKVLLPYLIEFEKTLILLALREKHTLQIGRTHGQHAEPITFGFALAYYVSRVGKAIFDIKHTSHNLRGKIAGAVGAYNASSLFFSNPADFEREVLTHIGIQPSPLSTQVVESEYMTEFVHSIIQTFGILANLADDMRHLQRSEIGEVGEEFGVSQVGSSTMPQKRNPINFENVKSLWKEFSPRMMTVYMDQISEHQRDLTNSASSRFVPEILAGFTLSVKRLNRTMSKLVVDHKNLKKNFALNREFIIAEPLYILLAYHRHPDAHEYVRKLTLESQKTGENVIDLLTHDPSMRPYLNKFSSYHLSILRNPEKYIGKSIEKTERVCAEWKKKLKLRL